MPTVNNTAYLKARRHRDKLSTLIHYGGDPPRCACCGVDVFEFLTIDHVNGGGIQHREEIGRHKKWSWFRLNMYPDGFQVLCFNCNCAKPLDGSPCPCQRRSPIYGELKTASL